MPAAGEAVYGVTGGVGNRSSCHVPEDSRGRRGGHVSGYGHWHCTATHVGCRRAPMVGWVLRTS